MDESTRVRHCVECGAAIRYSGLGQPPKTCGERCRQDRKNRLERARWEAAPKHRRRTTIPPKAPRLCRGCGTEFIPPAGRGRFWFCPQCQVCSVKGCSKPRKDSGLCSMHAKRVREHGETGGPEHRPQNPRAGQGWLAKGYRRYKVGGETIAEHRKVMEQVLGRPLYDFENVHHRNGIRSDNRPGNLELWAKPPTSGQRPEDLAAWVVEFYPELVEAALARR